MNPLADALFGAFNETLSERVPTVREYCDRVILPDGSLKGTTYNPDLCPAQSCIIQAIDAGATHITVAKPVQSGGSLVTTVPILRRAMVFAQSCLVAFPTMDVLKEVFETKLRPMLTANGTISIETDAGGGSRGGTARAMKLPSGGTFFLRSAGGRGESGQASITADCMLVDEVDDWGDVRKIRLLERRMNASPDPFSLYVSTVKGDGEPGTHRASIILTMHNEGTQTRLTYPCPECGLLQTFEWENVDLETLGIRCPCGHLITEHERVQALRSWRRLDLNPDAKKFSIRWTALDSPFPIVMNGQKFPVLEALRTEYNEARLAAEKGEIGLLRQFFRDRLTTRFIDDDVAGVFAATETDIRLAAAQSTLKRGITPAGVHGVVVSVDVQLRRIYFAAVAYDNERRYIVQWGKIAVCGDHETPLPGQLEAAFQKINGFVKSGFPCEDGSVTNVRLVVVDSGFRTDIVRSFVAKQGGMWLSLRGFGGESAVKTMKSEELGSSDIREPGWYDLRKQPSMVDKRQMLIDKDPCIERLALSWSAGTLVPANDVDNELVRHLAAYQRNTDSGKWESGKARVDFHDAVCYADCGIKLMQRIRPGPARGPTSKSSPSDAIKPTRRTGTVRPNIYS